MLMGNTGERFPMEERLVSLQPGVLHGTGQAQPCSLPCQPLGTQLGQRHGRWHRVGGMPGRCGCTHQKRAQGSILRHPLPVQLQTSLAGKGPLRDPGSTENTETVPIRAVPLPRG